MAGPDSISITTEHVNNVANPIDDIRRYATAGSVMIPVEVLEKLYLNPPQKVDGNLRRTFGNPTPLYVLIFPRHTSCIILPN